MRGVRIGLDDMWPDKIDGPNMAVVKRSGWACAWGSDRDSCEHQDHPAL